MRETRVWSLGREDPLQKEMATHSSILAWRIPWMEDSGGLQSTGSQRVRHDWETSLALSLYYLNTRNKWVVLDVLSLSLLWYLLIKSPWDLNSVFDSAVQWGSRGSNWHHRFCIVVWNLSFFFILLTSLLAVLYICLVFGDKLEISESNEMRWSLRSCPTLWPYGL